ncbi:MAG: CYTH domain-containing protein [Clostridiaceae bacterium]|nr:CYTH domain-containing protein [Clostridiaceae bacterium]
METELKLRFIQDGDRSSFFTDPWIADLLLPDSRQNLDMHSQYYDTAAGALTIRRASLRIRREDDRRIATVKLGKAANNGLHQRLEWSVVLDDDAMDWSDQPEKGLDAAWFLKLAVSDGDPDDRLRELLLEIDGQPLLEICQADFTRTAYDIGYGDTLMELALDKGELRAGPLTAQINELELELKEGDVRDLMALGDEMQARYDVEPESQSKYARCLALLRQIQENEA